MTQKTAPSQLSRDIQEVLEAARNRPAARKELPVEPEELEEAPRIEAVFGMIANGCGRHEAAKETADFISPLLLAA